MNDAADGNESYLPLSSDEQKVLELYDRLQGLRLEVAIMNAQQTVQTSKWHSLKLMKDSPINI